MKIALVHNFHSGSTPSGENIVVVAEAEALARAGHEIQILRIDNDAMAARPLNQVRGALTVATGRGPSPLDLLEGGFTPDVLHVHNLFPHFGNRWVAETRIPIVTTLHNYRSMCANGFLFRDGDVCTLCMDGKPWSGVRYACYQRSGLATLPLAIANRFQKSPLLNAARKNLVLSDTALEVFLRAGIPASRLVRDWHFVPDQLAGHPAAETGKAWLCVGRLTFEKGVDRLVAEWPADVPLVVVGDGRLRDKVASAASGKMVEIKGNLTRAQVMEEMRASFGLVAPSLWYETFGMAYIEALSAGLPVMAMPPNVIAEKVAQEGTGVVAEWGRLTEALVEAGRTFGGLRGRCREVFEDRYDEKAWLDRRIRLYKSVIA